MTRHYSGWQWKIYFPRDSASAWHIQLVAASAMNSEDSLISTNKKAPINYHRRTQWRIGHYQINCYFC